MGLPRGSRPQPQQTSPGIRPRSASDAASTPIMSRDRENSNWFDDSPKYTDSQSPIPFICTQDGSYGENEVIWSYYSPKSKKHDVKRTPIRKRKVLMPVLDFSPISSAPPKRPISRKSTEYLNELKAELLALNFNIQQKKNNDSGGSASNSAPSTSKSTPDEPINPIVRLKTRITEKIIKCENEGIESDDSMNEYLIRASQMIEDVVEPVSDVKLDLESPISIEDSFDVLISNINDSTIQALSQTVVKASNSPQKENKVELNEESWTNISNFSSLINNDIKNDSKNKFSRHKSMPETPNSRQHNNQKKTPSAFGRRNTLPIPSQTTHTGQCSTKEIERKRELARQKLRSKRSDKRPPSISPLNVLRINEPKENQSHVPKVPSQGFNNNFYSKESAKLTQNKPVDSRLKESNIRSEIERKRREAMLKLERKRNLYLEK